MMKFLVIWNSNWQPTIGARGNIKDAQVIPFVQKLCIKCIFISCPYYFLAKIGTDRISDPSWTISGLCAISGPSSSTPEVGISGGGWGILRNIMSHTIGRSDWLFRLMRPQHIFIRPKVKPISHEVLNLVSIHVVTVIQSPRLASSCNYICLENITGYIQLIY